MNEPLLQLDNLVKHFELEEGLGRKEEGGTVRALDGVSFSIDRGETFGLVGESGCGKSTLGLTVLQLYRPTAGKVLFESNDLTAMSEDELKPVRKRLQMIFQDPYASLDPRMTVGNIVQEPLDIHRVGKREERRARLVSLLEMVGLSEAYVDRYPHEFSGGQRQRIGIARAIALNPSLIICDEPVSALDVSIQVQILNLLQDLQDELNLTYMFIAHNLAVVAHISDRIGVMYLGKLIEAGADRRGDEQRPAPLYAEPAVRRPGDQQAAPETAHSTHGRRAQSGRPRPPAAVFIHAAPSRRTTAPCTSRNSNRTKAATGWPVITPEAPRPPHPSEHVFFPFRPVGPNALRCRYIRRDDDPVFAGERRDAGTGRLPAGRCGGHGVQHGGGPGQDGRRSGLGLPPSPIIPPGGGSPPAWPCTAWTRPTWPGWTGGPSGRISRSGLGRTVRPDFPSGPISRSSASDLSGPSGPVGPAGAGVFFLEPGTPPRGSRVVYDRARFRRDRNDARGSGTGAAVPAPGSSIPPASRRPWARRASRPSPGSLGRPGGGRGTGRRSTSTTGPSCGRRNGPARSWTPCWARSTSWYRRRTTRR